MDILGRVACLLKRNLPSKCTTQACYSCKSGGPTSRKKIHLEAFGAGHSPDLRSKLLHCFCSLGESENDTDFIYSAEQLATNKMLPTLHFAGRTWAPSLQTVKFQVGSKEPADNQRGTCLMAWVRESRPAGLPAGASESLPWILWKISSDAPTFPNSQASYNPQKQKNGSYYRQRRELGYAEGTIQTRNSENSYLNRVYQ